MLDIIKIRNEPDFVKKALMKRIPEVDLDSILILDQEKRELSQESEFLKAERNRVSSLIPQLKKKGEDVQSLLSDMKILSLKISEQDKIVASTNNKLQDLLSRLPNIPAEHVAPGGKENNTVLRTAGIKPVFNFTQKNHVELVKDLNLIDYRRGVKLGGSGNWIYKGTGALLEWALLNYFIEEHTNDGYEFILPPHILNYECGFTAGQFPKFDEDVYYIESNNDKKNFILPTSETALVNLHRDEILKEEQLPAKYFAYTPCYRKEAGSYRTKERGMIRGHQFNKVELFQFSKPEGSQNALQEMIQKVEKIMTDLELHYQVSKLAAGDCSAAMAETIDIEVWIPSMNLFKEVSSASNANDYQGRRGNIRYKDKNTGKNTFVHTLNASGLATSRLIPAILEQHQNADGSVRLPKVLQNRLGLGCILQ